MPSPLPPVSLPDIHLLKGTVVTVLRFTWQTTLGLISIGLIVAACSAVTSNQGTGRPAGPEASADGQPSPSAARQSVPVSGSPSPSIAATATDEPPASEPPPAAIAVDGGDPVMGQLGSYTWQNAGSDAPWLDGRPIHVGAGERLTVRLADSLGIATWSASRVMPGNRSGINAIGMAEGSDGPVSFDAPPPGIWSVAVNVWFSNNRGSAAYYWLVSVQ